MTSSPINDEGTVRNALREIVTEFGPALLSDPAMLSSLLADLLPDAPNVARVLAAAAQHGLAGSLLDYVSGGMDAGTATQLAAAAFAHANLLAPDTCAWIAAEVAVALGMTAESENRSADAPDAAAPVPQPRRPYPAETVTRQRRASPAARAHTARQTEPNSQTCAGASPRAAEPPASNPSAPPPARRRRLTRPGGIFGALTIAVVAAAVVFASAHQDPAEPPAPAFRVAATIKVGVDPVGITAYPQIHRVYVANYYGNSVSVINSTTNAVVESIKVPTPSVFAMNQRTGLLYVITNTASAVTVINAKTNEIVAAIKVGHADAAAADKQNDTIYVGIDGFPGQSYVAAINGRTSKIAARIPVRAVPYGIAVNIPADIIYEAGFDGPMSVINASTNKVSSTIGVPGDAFMIVAVNRQTRIIYGTDCAAAGRVFVVDGNSSKIIASAPVGPWPRGLASYAPGGILFVADSLGRSVSVVSEKTSKVITTVQVGNEPSDVTLASNHSAYVANKLSNTVSVITWP